MYGENNYAQYLSECTDQVSKGKLPSVLNNFTNRKYYFRFITINDYVFYGYFDKIYTTEYSRLRKCSLYSNIKQLKYKTW